MDKDLSLRFKSEEEAKKRAREDLKTIVKSRLTCKSLQVIREELEAKKEEVDNQLLYNIEKKVQELSKSVQTLTEREQVTKDVRLKISQIRDIWKNSSGKFADISEDVNELLLSKRHAESVMGMLQNFLDIESKVEELKDKLSDQEEIMHVYKKIKIMNCMRMSFLQRIEQDDEIGGSNSSNSSKLKKIKEHFRAVGEVEKQFQEIIFQNIQNTHILAQKNPQLLVKVMRIIENEEITNQSLKEQFKKYELEEKKNIIPRDTAIVEEEVKKGKKKKSSNKFSELLKQEESLKDKCISMLKQTIRKRAAEFYQDLTGEKNQKQFMLTLQQSEALMQDLKNVGKTIVPCFPPHYQIFDLYFNTYKRELQEKIDSFLNEMDSLLNQDPEIILLFNSFVQTCQTTLNEMNFQDEIFTNLQFRLQEYYPRFMDHAETKFFERLQRILEEQKIQELDKIEQFAKQRKKKIAYETTFTQDIYDFMNTQLEAIQESLKGEKLLEFIKRMLEQLMNLIQHMVEKSTEFEPKNPRALVSLIIRLNDLTKVANEYEKFKENATKFMGEQYFERTDIVLDDYFRVLIEHIHVITEIIALFIVKSEIEQDLLLHFFTAQWKEENESMLKEVLKCAAGYMQDVFKLAIEERFGSKIAEGLYCLIIDAYIERFIIAVNQRFKLKLPIEKALLDYVYLDSKRKKRDKDKIIKKKQLIDFLQKGIDQELFELMQQDIKQFQLFREEYKEDIMQNRFNRKIQLLSLVSMMINAADENEFASYEEQFWSVNGQSVGMGTSYVEGNHLVRVCRKLKTRKQKGWFKETKKKEAKEKKMLKKQEKNMLKKKKTKRNIANSANNSMIV